MSSPTEQLAPALDIDARLTEIERRVNLLVNVTPLNAAEASAVSGSSPAAGARRATCAPSWDSRRRQERPSVAW